MVGEYDDRQPTVLVLEDEEGLADLYANWLSTDYAVRTAYTAADAREQFDDAVGVALIDRRLPDESGDEVLRWIRAESEVCRTVMVTAVNPDFDIVDLPFDEYLVKPIDRATLVETVESLERQRAYDDDVRALYTLLTKKARLEEEKYRSELEASDAYAELEAEIEDLGQSVRDAAADLDVADFDALLARLSTDSHATDFE